MTTAIPLYKVIVLYFAIICLILTALLLIWPQFLVAANRRLKKWVSTASWEKAMNQTRDIDQHLLGMHKILGYITLLLAVIFVVLLIL